MKKTIKRENGTIRSQICFKKSKQLTDQSYKKMCDINLIMKQYQKTGMLPHFKKNEPIFADVSDIPSLEEAHEIVNDAKELFLELPAEVRKAMDHDPAKLESFIADEKNHDLLVKHGIMEKQQVTQEVQQEAETEAISGDQ